MKLHLRFLLKTFFSFMLPAHFDDATDDISRLMKPIWSKFLQELPQSPTRNKIANYEK